MHRSSPVYRWKQVNYSDGFVYYRHAALIDGSDVMGN